MCDISLNDLKYYLTQKSFQRKLYHTEVIKLLLLKQINPSLFRNKQQNIKTIKYAWKLVDRNCPEYGIYPVYGELTLHNIIFDACKKPKISIREIKRDCAMAYPI